MIVSAFSSPAAMKYPDSPRGLACSH